MKLAYNDKLHAYWLDGKRCKGVTTVAKIPDDTYSLDQWRARMIVAGMAFKPDLVEQAAAHHDERDKLQSIADDALVAAKAHDAANRGTAIHRITERVDLGLEVIDTPLSRAVRVAWLRALDLAGLEVVPELVERIVVYPDQRVAGRFDRFCRRKLDGRFAVVDLKSGEGAIKYPHSIAVQLALYAGAPLMAGPIPGSKGETEQFESLPDVDRELAYVVHMPSPDRVEVHGVDIGAARPIVERVIFPVLEWRKRDDLIVACAEVTVETEATSDSGSDGVDDRAVPDDRGAVASGGTTRTDSTPAPAADSTATASGSAFDVENDAVEFLKAKFEGSTDIAHDDWRQRYVDWLTKLTTRHPDVGPAIMAELDRKGLRKSLRTADWTNGELQTLAGILRVAERAARPDLNTHTHKHS